MKASFVEIWINVSLLLVLLTICIGVISFVVYVPPIIIFIPFLLAFGNVGVVGGLYILVMDYMNRNK